MVMFVRERRMKVREGRTFWGGRRRRVAGLRSLLMAVWKVLDWKFVTRSEEINIRHLLVFVNKKIVFGDFYGFQVE